MLIPLLFIRHGSRNPQLHFCAGSRFGPEVQSRSDSLGPLPNSRQTPMSGAAAGFLKCEGQSPWFSLDNHAKAGKTSILNLSTSQFLPGSGEQLRKVVLGY